MLILPRNFTNMKKAGFFAIRIFSGFLGIQPFFILYGLSDITALVLQYLVGYRRKVVQRNLKNCFPEKSAKELAKIERKFYRNLSDITIETFKGLYMSKKQISKRFKVLNPEVMQKYFERGQDTLGLASHYANWEWGILGVDFQIPHQAVSIYKPMHNEYAENFSFKRRSRFGMKLIAIKETKAYFASEKEKPNTYILAADQHPNDKKKSIVVDFFNIETASIHGPEAYGRNTGMPILYFDIQRAKRGHYTMEIIELFEHPKSTSFGEITQKYMSTVESIIRRKPENWLWSHKRWKYTNKDIERIKSYNQEWIEKEKAQKSN